MPSCLYICSTYYHVLVTICKVILYHQQADIILCDDIPEIKRLQISLIQANCFTNVLCFDSKRIHEYLGKNIVDWIFFQHKKSKKEIEKEFKIDVNRYQDIYIFHDDILLGHYLNDIKKRYHLLEDAQDFYKIIDKTSFARCLPEHNIKYKLRRLLRSGYFPLGQSPYVIDIEVNDKNDLVIQHKNIIELRKSNLFACVENWKILIDIFLPKNNFDLFFSSPELEYGLLLTQTLVEDGLVDSEEEKIFVYSRIIEWFNSQNIKVVIKPHPRDKTNYATLFPEAFCFSPFFPVEILNYIPKIYFSCAVTISSTSLNILSNVKKKYWFTIQDLINNNIVKG